MTVHFNKTSATYCAYTQIMRSFKEETSKNSKSVAFKTDEEFLKNAFSAINSNALIKHETIISIAKLVFDRFNELIDQENTDAATIKLFSTTISEMKNCSNNKKEFEKNYFKLKELVEIYLFIPSMHRS